MAVSRLMQFLSLSRDSNSDDSDGSNETTIRHNGRSEATDLDLSIPPRKERHKAPTAVTRIWDRPNGIRSEYPQLGDRTHLDHAALCGFAIRRLNYTEHLKQNLYGNPHSASSPSAFARDRVDLVRIQALSIFKANPFDFDLVFVANATAAIKLVGECFHDCASSQKKAFWYGYHNDAHTSLVGVRGYSNVSRCFENDGDVETWIEEGGMNGNLHEHERGHEREDVRGSGQLGLFAYPGQSNMNGRRLPVGPAGWAHRIRSKSEKSSVFTLLDAASLASTTPLDLSDAAAAPDYVAVSFYKIFGFPNIGGLIVRKDSAWPLYNRRYFGGGTVDMVVNKGPGWHAVKASQIPERLEDGTVPFLSISALGLAIAVHHDLYGPNLEAISEHTTRLARELDNRLTALKYDNGFPVVRIYRSGDAGCWSPARQGPVIALNVLRADGTCIGYRDVEDAADGRDIHVRSGSLCNPGGTSSNLEWSPDEMRRAYETSGHRCSEPIQILDGRPTGMVRVSLGAMNTGVDVDTFVAFVAGLAEMECNAFPQLAPERVESWIDGVTAVSAQG